MRVLARILMAVLGVSLLAMVAAWGFGAIGRAAGIRFSLDGPLHETWPAAVGFAAMPIAAASLVALLLLAAAWVVRDLLRTRD